MATQYTSFLGLALPVTGELSGSWGDVVNDSITSLLDSAIAGTTTLSTDGDVTLTTTTGASNQARQAILLCSGARTALRTITAPAQSKIYTVINATTGGYSVKVVGAGPTTGVTIVAGESAVIAWNGSDFIKVSNTGGGGSFTNVTVSGTTTLSGLTASTALALDASKNVVSVTNTGTGNNVLSASPTLTGTLAAAAATFSGNVTLGDATTDTVTVNGYMGVGGAGNPGRGIQVVSTALTGGDQIGVYSNATASSSATTALRSFYSVPKTAIAAFTCANIYGFSADDASLGAGSSVTNLVGVQIADQTQGTNNYGLRSLVSSGTNKWNIYASGTADNYFAGRVGFGTTSLGGGSGQYRFSGSITGAVTSNGIYYTPTVQSDVTTAASIIVSQPSTAAASFTLTTLSHFLANQSTIGAGSTVTNQYGFNVANSLTGATNNYGFYGGIAAATGRWNLYMAGTAANYLAGPLTVAATGANGIDLNASSTDSARLFFSTSTAGQGWSMVNGGGIFRLSPAATAGVSTALPVFTITQAGQFAFLPDTVTQSMTLTSTGVLLLGTTSATGSTVKLQVNSDAYINSLTVGKGTASLSANTALGVNALLAITTGNNNTAVGFGAGDAITTGASNIAIGPNALGAAQTVSNNIAIGATALLQATAGDNNVAIGGSAMTGAVTGGNNTAIGAAVMGANTSGADNTSVGYLSMSNNTTGSNNTSLGRRALWGNTTTSNNVAIGYFALDDVLTGGNGTAVGFQALTAATGGNNTALGYSAGGTTTTGTTNLFLGYQAGNLITTGGKNVIIGSYQGNSGGLDIRTSSNYIVLSDGDANIRQVIDSSGNLGLGVTPSAWGSGKQAFENQGFALWSGATSNFLLGNNVYQNSGGTYIYKNTAAASMYYQSSGTHVWYNAPSGTAGNAITFTQAMTLDASGRLGIGETSPAYRVSVRGTPGSTGHTECLIQVGTDADVYSAQAQIRLAGKYGDAGYAYIAGLRPSGGTATDNALVFGTVATERARIDSSGNWLLGATSSSPAGTTSQFVNQWSGGSKWGISLNQTVSSATAYTHINFSTNGTTVGNINANNTATTYATSSDYRLKNITGPITTSGAYIDSLNPVEGTWKADGSTFVGLIAHEVQEASRTPVATGVKDGEEMQGMDYSSAELIANMLAELKSLRARVAALESI